MVSIKDRGVAVVLALAMVAVTVPVTPTASAGNLDDCEKADLHADDRGWVGVSHPLANQDVRASQTLYLRLFNQNTVDTLLGKTGDQAQRWTNGQDAYVVELPCQPDSTFDYCIERINIFDDRNDFVGFQFLEPNGDFRVAFYGPGPTYDLKGDHDPTAQENVNVNDDDSDPCTGTVPAGSVYAVVYLASGAPAGVQIDDMLYGPYSEHFKFHLHGPLT